MSANQSEASSFYYGRSLRASLFKVTETLSQNIIELVGDVAAGLSPERPRNHMLPDIGFGEDKKHMRG